MSRLTRDRTAEPVSRDHILRPELGRGNIIFLCLANHEQDWQPYPVDPDGHTLLQVMAMHAGALFPRSLGMVSSRYRSKVS